MPDAVWEYRYLFLSRLNQQDRLDAANREIEELASAGWEIHTASTDGGGTEVGMLWHRPRHRSDGVPRPAHPGAGITASPLPAPVGSAEAAPDPAGT